MQAVLFLQRVAAFSLSIKHHLPRVKRLLHLQESLLLLVVPISHKTINAFPAHLIRGRECHLLQTAPGHLLLPGPHLATPGTASSRLVFVYLVTVTSFQMWHLVPCRMDRCLCSVRSWEKQIGEALCSVDLNRDVGDFLPVGPSAQSFTAPERTG